ncbi:hypothetical protein [Pedobacter xixiisoli]|uniref:YD repeat-containing protein n=1 Tax=Pedobacter xixiisoli TaxID=1476464 RepID=A0A286A8W4_9SPHI|nr:hypothetical protein [Pedobacter xixiisoli]SOD18358.1 hypothetical protein SAMN06297358_2959 [Pedobacter xixiisoli]
MKKLNILLIILISTLISCAQEKTAHKPIIKSEEIIFYKLDEGGKKKTQEGPGMDELVEYNTDGKTSKVYVIEFDKAKNKNIYYLNERYFYEGNNLIKKEKLGYLTGDVYEEVSYKYIQDKLVKKDTRSIENGKEVLKKDGSFYSDYVYGDNIEIEKVYEYDDQKKAFVLAYISHKLFDVRNNVIQEKLEDTNGEIYEQKDLTYNKENKLIKEIQSIRNPSTITYQYNEEGDIIENKYESEGNIVTINYFIKYDFNKKWTEKKEVTTTNVKRQIPEPESIINRKIVYY